MRGTTRIPEGSRRPATPSGQNHAFDAGLFAGDVPWLGCGKNDGCGPCSAAKNLHRERPGRPEIRIRPNALDAPTPCNDSSAVANLADGNNYQRRESVWQSTRKQDHRQVPQALFRRPMILPGPKLVASRQRARELLRCSQPISTTPLRPRGQQHAERHDGENAGRRLRNRGC